MKTKKSGKHTSYTIESFGDFMDVVNEKNADMLCGNFYGLVLQFIKMRKVSPKLKFEGFTWIDDGKIEIRNPKIVMNASGEYPRVVPVEKANAKKAKK